MARFCPKCGKSIDTGVFCSDCKPRTLDFKESTVKICCECQKIFIHGAWARTSNIKNSIIKEISTKIKQKDVKISSDFDLPEFKPGIQKEFFTEVTKDGVVYNVPFRVEITYCGTCSKKGTQYFEGILQVRNMNKESQKVIDYQLRRESTHGNNVNKIVEFDNGVDYYMTNKKFIPKIAQRIVDILGGLYTLNAKLFSHNHLTGKDIYRLNVHLELPKFKIGDVFLYIDKYIIIQRFGKNISARNLLTGKKVMFTYKEFKSVQEKDVDKAKKLDVFETTIIKLRPQQEVLHPENYQPIKVLNPIKDAKEDDKVKIIVTDKGAIII